LSKRPLFYSAFVMNTASHVLHGLWRAPEAANHEFNSLRHWTKVAAEVDKATTLRACLGPGRGDRLPDTHPAAAHRGAFSDNDLLNGVDEPVGIIG
jgi:hypothetical protein